MPTNYERLSENKESTLANIKRYIDDKQIDAKERYGELVEQIKNQELGSDLILKLEEIRDLAIGVTWKQYNGTHKLDNKINKMRYNFKTKQRRLYV